jgi:peptidoglycan/LPS O-acetylase OafA/YrhL
MNEVAPVKAPASRRFYQSELDGLRFYAFLGVFVCHTLPLEASFYRNLHLPMPWLWGATAKAGAAGVDLFFALSAFLITSLLLRSRRSGRYFTQALLSQADSPSVCIFWSSDWASCYHTMANQHLQWYYVAGYLLFAGIGYMRLRSAGVIAFPLWTVSIEEQFYLVWPLLERDSTAT